MATKNNKHSSGEKSGSPDEGMRASGGSGRDAYGAELEGLGEDDLEYGLESESQVIEAILSLGNEVWRNFGQEQALDEVEIFF